MTDPPVLLAIIGIALTVLVPIAIGYVRRGRVIAAYEPRIAALERIVHTSVEEGRKFHKEQGERISDIEGQLKRMNGRH